MSKPVCIVIPVYNKWELTAPCLESLARHTDPSLFEVVVADNASTDDTASQCPGLGRELLGDAFRYLRFDANRNFGPACNAGARASQSPNVLFLNNDTLVTPGWLDAVLPVVQRPEVGAAGSLLLYPPMGRHEGLVEHVGLAFEPRCYPGHVFEFFHCGHPAVQTRRNWQGLTGAALCLRREVFEASGGFCEEYVNGGEDVDLSLHVRAMGLELHSVPESVVYHLKSQTPGRHSHERHNAAVLKRRCLELISPDLVHYLRRTGYDMHLNARLQVCMDIPGRRMRFLAPRLDAARSSDDLDALYALVRDEPVYADAWRALARAEQDAGNAHGAVLAAYLCFRISKDYEHLIWLRDLAAQMGDEDMRGYAVAVLARNRAGDFQEFVDAARATAALYDGFPDAAIAPLYRDWLERADEMRGHFGLEDDAEDPT